MPATQTALDTSLVQRWVCIYLLPTDTVRLDRTSVSVYQAPPAANSLLQRGHSKDFRPDLAQFTARLATLDPLGLPLACQTVAGNCADDPLYIPAYEAAVATLGSRDVLVVGDSKMAALETRGHLTAHQSRYLCRLHAPWAVRDIAAWVATALCARAAWERWEDRDPRTGAPELRAEAHTQQRAQTWTDPRSGEEVTWTERVLLIRGQAYGQRERAKREKALVKLTAEWAKLGEAPGPGRGRRRYRSQAEWEAVVAERIAAAGFRDVVAAPVVKEQPAEGVPYWVVGSIVVGRAAWTAQVDRLGWPVLHTSTTAGQCGTAAIVETYHAQVVHERDFARLKSRALHIRPVYGRDEQRIAGLMWLLMLALWVLVITEQRLRAELAERGESLAGLNPARRRQRTTRPTTERVREAFGEGTLTRWRGRDGEWAGHITPLTATQQHILVLLKLPADLYARLTHVPPIFALNLRE